MNLPKFLNELTELCQNHELYIMNGSIEDALENVVATDFKLHEVPRNSKYIVNMIEGYDGQSDEWEMGDINSLVKQVTQLSHNHGLYLMNDKIENAVGEVVAIEFGLKEYPKHVAYEAKEI